MIEDKVVQVEYRKLNPVCAYCDNPASVIRVSLTMQGSVMVATLCEEDAKGEKADALENGFIMQGLTSIAGALSDATLINPETIQEIEKAIEQAYEQSREIDEKSNT